MNNQQQQQQDSVWSDPQWADPTFTELPDGWADLLMEDDGFECDLPGLETSPRVTAVDLEIMSTLWETLETALKAEILLPTSDNPYKEIAQSLIISELGIRDPEATPSLDSGLKPNLATQYDQYPKSLLITNEQPFTYILRSGCVISSYRHAFQIDPIGVQKFVPVLQIFPAVILFLILVTRRFEPASSKQQLIIARNLARND